MKKMVKFTLAILISTIMVYCPNVFAEGSVTKPENACKTILGEDGVYEIKVTENDTFLYEGRIFSADCYKNNTAIIELIYEHDSKDAVWVTNSLLKKAESEGLTLVIKAKDNNNKELYTATITPKDIINDGKSYNVTVWLEELSSQDSAKLEEQGYNGLASLKAANENILNATYKIDATGILENGTYGVLGKDYYTVKTTSLTVSNNSLEVADTSLFGGYIFTSKEVHNTPLPTPSTSTSSSNSSSSNNTSKEVVEFKQEIVSQSLSIPSSKYEDVIKDTIASDENLKDKLANGANVVIKGEKAPVSERSQNSFKAVIQGGMILDYVDIKINLQSNNQDYPITNLKDKIELALTIPPAPAVENGYYREYYVLREHDGNIERLDSKVSEDGKTITFSSDKFSVYAVGYVDRKINSSNINNPKTNDSIYFMISTVMISAVGIYLSIKRMITNK